MPPGEAAFVKLYHWDGAVWTPLPTTLMSSSYYNEATAPLHGPGLYVLMSSLELPLHNQGWNLFSYPVQATRPVTQALQSIADVYTMVYGYVSSDTVDPWKLYAQDVPDYVNQLRTLEFGGVYWISVTQAITLNLKGATSVVPAHTSVMGYPPATYYGPITAGADFTPTVGMKITAWIADHLCGQGQTQAIAGEIVYTLDVFAAGPENGGLCGVPGKPVRFHITPWATYVGSDVTWMQTQGIWQNDSVHYLPLSPAEKTTFRVYLPLILR